MEGHLEETRARVRSWIESFEHDAYDASDTPDEPPTKRSRIDSTDDPSRVPGTTCKRRNAEVEADNNDEPEVASDSALRMPSLSVSQPRGDRKTTTPKTRSDLEDLQKPLYVEPFLINSAMTVQILPPDCSALYRRLQDCAAMVQIMPLEIRDELEKAGEILYPHYFRERDKKEDAQATAKAVLKEVHNIRKTAWDSFVFGRHESAWNALVHTPLLGLVFTLNILGDWREIKTPSGVSARLECATGITIAGDSVPVYDNMNADDTIVHPACSVSAGEAATSSEAGSYQYFESRDLSHLEFHSRSGSNKVDFVVALDVPENSPLRHTISDLKKYIYVTHGSFTDVNQTAYPPLTRSPIAVSIETWGQCQGVDTFVQLCIWIAAWHKHMYHLRGQLGLMKVAQKEPTTPQPRLVSLPLIQVIGQDWELYFACDLETSIKVYGPMRIGSTESIPSIYALLSSLEVIKEWVETTFFSSMKAWFMC